MIENFDILFRVSNEEEFRKSTATVIEEPPNINNTIKVLETVIQNEIR